jgi:hypothetical protein
MRNLLCFVKPIRCHRDVSQNHKSYTILEPRRNSRPAIRLHLRFEQPCHEHRLFTVLFPFPFRPFTLLSILTPLHFTPYFLHSQKGPMKHDPLTQVVLQQSLDPLRQTLFFPLSAFIQ